MLISEEKFWKGAKSLQFVFSFLAQLWYLILFGLITLLAMHWRISLMMSVFLFLSGIL